MWLYAIHNKKIDMSVESVHANVNTAEKRTCNHCSGKGYFDKEGQPARALPFPFSSFVYRKKCSLCEGAGELNPPKAVPDPWPRRSKIKHLR